MNGTVRLFKKNKRIAVLLLAVFLCLGLLSAWPVKAYAKTGDLVTLEETKDITVIIEYDSAEPKVTLIDPRGKKYEKDEDYALVQRGEGIVYYYIDSASSGTWKIDYEKGNNQKLSATVVPWHQSISLTDLRFTIEQDEDQTVNAEYSVTYEKGSYNTVLSAVKLNEQGSIETQVQLAESRGRGTGTETIRGSLKNLPDGEYYLMVRVYATDDSVEVTDWIISEKSFSVSGNTKTGETENLSILADLTNGVVSISFRDPDNLYGEKGLVVTQGGTVLYEKIQEEAEWKDSVLADPKEGDLLITVNAYNRDNEYVSWTRNVSMVMPGQVSIGSEGRTNEAVGLITYDTGDKNYLAHLILGDQKSDVNLHGSGTLQVPLEDMKVNELIVQVESEEVLYQISKRITSDRIAPVIDIYGAEGTIRTQEKSILFIGSTDPDATLTCNGESVEKGSDGSFSYEAALAEGENTFSFEAVDPFGNAGVRTITVLKGDTVLRERTETPEKSGGFPFMLIITFLFALFFLLILIAVGLISNRYEGRGKRLITILAVLSAALFVLGAYCFGGMVWQLVRANQLKNSIRGSSLVGKLKVDDASVIAETLQAQKEASHLALILLIIGVILIAAAVGVLLLRRVLKNRKPSEPKPKKQKPAGTASASPRFCPHCGAQIRSGGAFCTSCGKPLKKS